MARRFPGVNVVIDHIAMIDIARPDSEGFGPLLDLARLQFARLPDRVALLDDGPASRTPASMDW